MRIIGLFAICLLFAACTTPPIFSPKVMKNVETDTFDVKTWVDQAYHPSDTTFVPHKAEVAGVILQVIRNQDGVVILAEEQPLKTDSAPSPSSVGQNKAPWFAITFQGALEPRMLQTGNRLIAVGTTSRGSAELFGGAPRMLPHLMAQCLHIWNTEEVKNTYLCNGTTRYAVAYPAEERTFCLEENTSESMSSVSHGEEKMVSVGSRSGRHAE